MNTTIDVARVIETIMTIPGMNETVKIDLKISRKNALLLNSVIKRGLEVKGEDKPGVLAGIPQEVQDELSAFAEECLSKAGLTELSDKLNALSTGK